MTNQTHKTIRRIVIIFLFVMGISFPLQSQNEIHLLGCDSILNCKKIKVYKGYISYTPIDTERCVLYLRNDSVAYVDINGKHYGPSAKEYFRIKDELFQNEISKIGALDACRNYSKYKGAATGTFITTYLAGGILGLIPAIATSQTTPKVVNLNMPGTESGFDEAYKKGYIQQAKNMKSGRVWSNYGYGILFAVITVVTINIIVGGISTLN
jgi:hypothetical protein